MGMFRRKPKGMQFTVRIPDEAMRTEVQRELSGFDIEAQVTDTGLQINAYGEVAIADVRTILTSHDLRGPGSTSPRNRAAGPDSTSDDEADD